MNHTSDAHPWFVASSAGRTGPYADWYLWRDPAGRRARRRAVAAQQLGLVLRRPGLAVGAARERSSTTTRSSPSSRSSNWRAPGVEAAQLAMVRGWLARGVDGFRLDVFNAFLKDARAAVEPDPAEGRTAWDRQVHLYDRDQPDFPELIGRFRAILDEAPGRMSVGELFDGTVETAAGFATDRHLVFDWALLGAPWAAVAIRAAIAEREAAFGDARWPTAVLSNHDQSRHVTAAGRLHRCRGQRCDRARRRGPAPDPAGDAVPVLRRRARPARRRRAAATESVDPPAAWVGPEFDWWDRSRSRTPMPWTDGPGAGFTSGRPWLRFGSDVGDTERRRATCRSRLCPGPVPAPDRPASRHAGAPGRRPEPRARR